MNHVPNKIKEQKMARFTFDISRLPLLVCTFPHDATQEECLQYGADLGELCRRYKGQNILYLIDARNMGPTGASREKRAAMAEGFNKIENDFVQAVIARAHVVDGKIAEGIFTAFFWLLKSQLTSPRKVFSNYDEAVNWLMKYKK